MASIRNTRRWVQVPFSWGVFDHRSLERLKWESPELTELVRLYRLTIRAVRAGSVRDSELRLLHDRMLALATARELPMRTTLDVYVDQRAMLA